jgi:hypothetical protein
VRNWAKEDEEAKVTNARRQRRKRGVEGRKEEMWK